MVVLFICNMAHKLFERISFPHRDNKRFGAALEMKKHIVPAAKSKTNTRHIRIKTKETQEEEQKKKTK